METKPGQPIDQAQLDLDMRHLFGTGDFEHVNYGFLEEPGRRIMAVDAVEKTYGPNYLRFGLGLNTDFRGDAYFNLVASHRARGSTRSVPNGAMTCRSARLPRCTASSTSR